MASISIQSYGCSANMNDGEIMAGLLKAAGHEIVRMPSDAEVIIVNTCVVKGRTEARMKTIIRKLSYQYPKKRVIVAGCMPQVKIEAGQANLWCIGPHNIPEIDKVVASAIAGRPISATGCTTSSKTDFPKLRGNPFIDIIQILEGCSGHCTYCIVKQAKPILLSSPVAAITADAKRAIADGCREIWLTSQDNASYMREHSDNATLPRLLQDIASLEGDFMIRVGMMNPDTILPALQPLISAYSSPKVFKFLHIPLQAGNDRVLKLMGRKYTVSQFKGIVTAFRKAFPMMSISTDVIAGFPTETEQEFEDTLELIRWLKPNVLNISRFFPRPNTPAEKMAGQVHGNVNKVRSEKLAALFADICLDNNKTWVGWSGEIIVDEKGKPGSYVGRNYAYRPVAVKSRANMLGKTINVRIAEAHKTYLAGEIIPSRP